MNLKDLEQSRFPLNEASGEKGDRTKSRAIQLGRSSREAFVFG
jgi:hypothetical protein